MYLVRLGRAWHSRCSEEDKNKLNATRRTLMVNTQLFQTLKGALLPNANSVNAEQAPAYAFTPRHRLAQLAATGCLGQTFYANAEAQLDAVLALAKELDAAFVAKTALYAREAGFMKDMPALLAATL